MKLIFNQAWNMGLPRDQEKRGAEQTPVEAPTSEPEPIAKPADQVQPVKSPE